MRTYRNSLILLLILIVLVGGYLAYQKYGNKGSDDNSPEVASEYILKLDKEKIKQVEITRNDQTMVFVREGTELVVKQPEGIDADKQVISSLEGAITSLPAMKVISTQQQDIEQFQLNQPAAIIKVILEDNFVKTLLIGGMTPSQNAYYAKLEDDPKIYSISTYFAENMLIDEKKLRSKKIFGYKAEDVQQIDLYKNDSLSFELIRKDETAWKLAKPIEAEADSEKVNELLTAATSITIKDFVFEAEDVSAYGLDKPQYAVDVILKDSNRIKVLIGNEKVRGEELYAQIEGKKDVLVLDEQQFNFIDKKPEDILIRLVYAPNINNVEKISVSFDGKLFTYTLETGNPDDKEDDKFFAESRQVADNQAFRTLYQGIIGTIINKIDLDVKVAGSTELLTEFYLKDVQQTVKIEYVPADSNNYYVIKNGEYTGIIAEKKSVDEAKNAVVRLQEITQ